MADIGSHTTTHGMLGAEAGAVFALIGAALVMQAAPAAAMGSWIGGEEADNCANDDGAFNEAASGNTQGGGVDGPGEFSFTVPYSVDTKQIGHLEVFAEDASDGEGVPPGRTVVPLVLTP